MTQENAFQGTKGQSGGTGSTGPSDAGNVALTALLSFAAAGLAWWALGHSFGKQMAGPTWADAFAFSRAGAAQLAVFCVLVPAAIWAGLAASQDVKALAYVAGLIGTALLFPTLSEKAGAVLLLASAVAAAEVNGPKKFVVIVLAVPLAAFLLDGGLLEVRPTEIQVGAALLRGGLFYLPLLVVSVIALPVFSREARMKFPGAQSGATEAEARPAEEQATVPTSN